MSSVGSDYVRSMCGRRRDPEVGRVKFGVLLDLAPPPLPPSVCPAPSSSCSAPPSLVTISTPCRLRVTLCDGA
jgi:hypothetical protein